MKLAANEVRRQYMMPSEVFLTNATIRDDEPDHTARAVEAKMQERYPDYFLRFDYDTIVVDGGRVVSSIAFGAQATNLPRGHARGVAVYGTPRK